VRISTLDQNEKRQHLEGLAATKGVDLRRRQVVSDHHVDLLLIPHETVGGGILVDGFLQGVPKPVRDGGR
jgi:hypothetical protein